MRDLGDQRGQLTHVVEGRHRAGVLQTFRMAGPAVAAAMKAELDNAEHVRVTGLAERLQQPVAWKPSLFQRPWFLAFAMLSPLVIAIIVLGWLLARRHG